jgi:hypothetical protein
MESNATRNNNVYCATTSKLKIPNDEFTASDVKLNNCALYKKSIVMKSADGEKKVCVIKKLDKYHESITNCSMYYAYLIDYLNSVKKSIESMCTTETSDARFDTTESYNTFIIGFIEIITSESSFLTALNSLKTYLQNYEHKDEVYGVDILILNVKQILDYESNVLSEYITTINECQQFNVEKIMKIADIVLIDLLNPIRLEKIVNVAMVCKIIQNQIIDEISLQGSGSIKSIKIKTHESGNIISRNSGYAARLQTLSEKNPYPCYTDRNIGFSADLTASFQRIPRYYTLIDALIKSYLKIVLANGTVGYDKKKIYNRILYIINFSYPVTNFSYKNYTPNTNSTLDISGLFNIVVNNDADADANNNLDQFLKNTENINYLERGYMLAYDIVSFLTKKQNELSSSPDRSSDLFKILKHWYYAKQFVRKFNESMSFAVCNNFFIIGDYGHIVPKPQFKNIIEQICKYILEYDPEKTSYSPVLQYLNNNLNNNLIELDIKIILDSYIGFVVNIIKNIIKPKLNTANPVYHANNFTTDHFVKHIASKLNDNSIIYFAHLSLDEHIKPINTALNADKSLGLSFSGNTMSITLKIFNAYFSTLYNDPRDDKTNKLCYSLVKMDNNQTGNNQTGNNQTGNNKTGNNKTGNNQTGNNQTGNNQTGNNQTGNNNSLADSNNGSDNGNNNTSGGSRKKYKKYNKRGGTTKKNTKKTTRKLTKKRKTTKK